MKINKIIDLHRYAYKGKTFFKVIILFLYSCFLLIFKRYRINKDFVAHEQSSNSFMFYKSLHRSDYDKLFNKITSSCEHPKIVIESNVVYGFDFSFFKNITRDLVYLKQIEANIVIERWYLFASYLFYKKILSCFDNHEFDYLVVFADMQPVESLVVQYFREKGKKTVTLQHGLFLDHSWNSNLNEVNYTNIVSQYFLTWGKENKKLIQKYNQEVEIVVCGNPIIEPVTKDSSGNKYFTVMFDSNLWQKYNQQMLDISTCVAKEIGCKINIRFHPANKIKDYNIDRKYVINDSSLNYYNSEFILGHTSSMIHVCMRQGLVVFKMTSDMPHSYIDPKFYFSNCNDILEKNKNLDEYKDIDYNHIEYIGNESLQKYKLFFDGL